MTEKYRTPEEHIPFEITVFYFNMKKIPYKQYCIYPILSFAFYASSILPQSENVLKEKEYRNALDLYNGKDYSGSLNIIREIPFPGGIIPCKFRILAAANYEQQTNYLSAIEHLKSCISENPNKIEAVLYLSGILRKLDRFAESEFILQNVLKKNPDSDSINIELVKHFYVKKDYARANQILTYLFDKHILHPDIYFLDGLILLRQKKFEMAEFRFRQLINESAKNYQMDKNMRADIYNNIGYAIEKRSEEFYNLKKLSKEEFENNLKKSEEMYRKAIQEAGGTCRIAEINLKHLSERENLRK